MLDDVLMIRVFAIERAVSGCKGPNRTTNFPPPEATHFMSHLPLQGRSQADFHCSGLIYPPIDTASSHGSKNEMGRNQWHAK
jgi:hypothetical protein